jgi:hypothetical protein
MKVKKTKCETVLLSMHMNEDSDMTLFTINNKSVENMKGQGLEIDFDFSPKAGQLLASHGFGMKHNQGRLTKYSPNATYDKDCAIVSPDDFLAYIENFKIKYTFANGCDTASGDSGSAMIDRETGKVVGLAWGSGNMPKKKKDRISSAILWNELVGTKEIRVWKYMSYAISLTALKDELSEFLDL